MQGLDRRRPYPFDVQLEHASLPRPLGLMLTPDQNGVKLTRRYETGLEHVTPTDYQYSSSSPFARRATLIKRLVMGYGQPLEEDPNSQRYDHAIGMDWSCGLGTLATRFQGPLTLSPGPIKDIKELNLAGVRHLYVLSGSRLYDSAATTIDPTTVFTLLVDFAAAVTLAAPTTGITGGAGSQHVRYRFSLQGGSVVAGQPGWPRTAASPEANLTTAPDTLDATHYVTVTWLNPLHLTATVYRSTDEGVTWNAVTTTTGLSYQDQGAVGTPATLPTDAVPQVPYQLWAGYYSQPFLWVGMDQGPYWQWDGTTWAQAVYEGRALTQQGFQFYRSSRTGPEPSAGATPRYNQSTVFTTTSHPILGGGTSGAAPVWLTPYQSLGDTPITRIAPIGGAMIVCEEARIAIGAAPLTAGNPVSTLSQDLTPERSSAPSADNGRCGVVWQGSFYTPYGSSFYRITPTGQYSATVDAIGPERLIENTSPVKGQVTAMTGWGAWHLFYVLYDSRTNTSYLCKWGAWVNPEQAHDPQASLLPVAHGALETWTGRANWMAISEVGEQAASGNPRLYVGFQDGTLRWTVLPRSSPFAPTDPACTFRSTGYTLLSRHTMGFQLDDKRYFNLTAYGPTLSPTLRVRFFYVLPDGTERELPGLATGDEAPLEFPEGTSGHWIQLKVQLETDTPADSPVVEGIALQEQLKPSFIEQLLLSADTRTWRTLRNGQPTHQSGATVLRALRDLVAYGDEIQAVLPGGERRMVAILGVEDRLLAGDARGSEHHTVSFTLANFQALTPTGG